MDYEIPEMIQRFFPGAWGGNDRDGRPIYILRVGDIDVRGIMKAVHGEDTWIRHVKKEIDFILKFNFYFYRSFILLNKV